MTGLLLLPMTEQKLNKWQKYSIIYCKIYELYVVKYMNYTVQVHVHDSLSVYLYTVSIVVWDRIDQHTLKTTYFLLCLQVHSELSYFNSNEIRLSNVLPVTFMVLVIGKAKKNIQIFCKHMIKYLYKFDSWAEDDTIIMVVK